MQSITVAIADENVERRARLEGSLDGEPGITVLANGKTRGRVSRERRRSSRENITKIEDAVARNRRLKPRILIASLQQCTEADCAMLASLRSECPGTLVVMLADESVAQEEPLLLALASGARGYLMPHADAGQISRAVRAIDRGEAWVPREMLGRIMDRVLHRSHGGSMEARLDPAG